MLENLPQLKFLPPGLETMENRHNPKPGKLVCLNGLCCQDANSGRGGGHSSHCLSVRGSGAGAGANQILLPPNLCSSGCVKQICDFSPFLGAQELEPVQPGITGYTWITLTLTHLELPDVQCWATVSSRMDWINPQWAHNELSYNLLYSASKRSAGQHNNYSYSWLTAS